MVREDEKRRFLDRDSQHKLGLGQRHGHCHDGLQREQDEQSNGPLSPRPPQLTGPTSVGPAVFLQTKNPPTRRVLKRYFNAWTTVVRDELF